MSPEPLLVQLWTTAKSHHWIPGRGAQHLPLFFTQQGAVESNEMTTQTPFLQTTQAQSPQSLLTGHSFQLYHQLYYPPLGTFKDLYSLLKWWGSALHPALGLRLHQHWLHQDNRLSWPAGDAVCDAPQEGVWALGCHRMHCWLTPSCCCWAAPSDLPSFRAALLPLLSQFIVVSDVTLS